MYACILETGRGFFEGVCAPGNASAYFRDPPPLLDSRIASPEAFHLDAYVAIAQLSCLPVFRGPLGTQPHRDVGWLHRLPYHLYQVVVQCLQVRFVAQLRREPFERLDHVVLPTIEATVYEGLDAMPQRVEQGRYQKGGGHDDQLR